VIRSYRQCQFQFDLLYSHSYQYSFERPGIIELPEGGTIEMNFTDSPFLPSDAKSAVFAADRVELPLIVRTRKDGDRMSLKGMPGTRKLKDIFIDYKIPIQDRNSWPVVTDREGCIIWLPGLKKSAVEGIGTKTGCYIQLTYTKSYF
jgi:tRNA(Ile)-lysidine synthase